MTDKERSRSLDWPKRYNIIYGIAKGLLYLHQDSRIRIIHRDLKAGNILLDHEMNQKSQTLAPLRVSGEVKVKQIQQELSEHCKTLYNNSTFHFHWLKLICLSILWILCSGYMSPEYALDGIFSFKSDVYSFGVLVLEIISGKRMKGFYQPDPSLNLLGQVS